MLVNRQYSVTYQTSNSSKYFTNGVQVSFSTSSTATTNHNLLLKAIAEAHNNDERIADINPENIMIVSATRMVDTP